jgi:hypothetical protein
LPQWRARRQHRSLPPNAIGANCYFGGHDVHWPELIFPELKEFEASQRERALRQALEEEFDTFERAGILAAVVVASFSTLLPSLRRSPWWGSAREYSRSAGFGVGCESG